MSEKPAGAGTYMSLYVSVICCWLGGQLGCRTGVDKAATPLETRGGSPVVKRGTHPCVALTSVSPDNFSSSSWLSWRSISRTVYSPFFS